jgi:hypothetical protein
MIRGFHSVTFQRRQGAGDCLRQPDGARNGRITSLPPITSKCLPC